VTTWSKSETLPDQGKLWEHVRTTKILKDDVTSNIGDAPSVIAGEGKRLSATYDFAIQTHGSIGHSCAVSAFRGGKLISWSASQATHNLRKQLALMFSLPLDDVRCVYVDGSGCYGRNGHEDAAADAALLAKAVGEPVRVQWSRADEHGWDPKGPPTLIDLRANIDASDTVTAWESEFFIPQGTPFRASWIRTPGRMQNTFANECFLDEIAAAVNADPLEFRVQYTDPADKRGHDVLDHLARLAKWEKRPSPQKPITGNLVKGRGCSYVKYELVRTYIGAVAEVEVDRATGEIRVSKFYVVHDCGQIVNPNGVKAQIEGCVIQTVSRVLKEELTFDRSMVTSLDWASYPILTFPEVPEIEIELIDRPTEKLWGAGEPTAALVPSSISNAVFDATGVRLRSVPFKRGKVKAALQSASEMNRR
jgi:nicotinate dehydrogenase subunit B